MGSFACANPSAGRPCVSTAADDSPPAAPATRGGSLTAATNSQPAAPCGHDPGGASTCSGKMPSGKWPPSLPLGIDRARSGKAAVRLRPHSICAAPQADGIAQPRLSGAIPRSAYARTFEAPMIKVGNKQARRTMVGVLAQVNILLMNYTDCLSFGD